MLPILKMAGLLVMPLKLIAIFKHQVNTHTHTHTRWPQAQGHFWFILCQVTIALFKKKERDMNTGRVTG